uniref:ISXO2-like transposase domain-containing protein n=1 Tax=Anopheles culicifacies TaxID=139723 RepID=A0A182MNS5_9DIPT
MKLKLTHRANGCKWICKPTTACTGSECTVRTNSVFKNSRLSLPQLIELTYEWSRNSTRTVTVAECCAGKTAVLRWYEILRAINTEYKENRQATIGDSGLTVEIHESVVTKRKYNRGRVADNNQTCDIFLELVQKRDYTTLQNIILRHVAPGSTILTDGRRAYNGLENTGFSHAMFNHSKNFVDPNDLFVHTQSIENLWGWIQQFIRSRIF